MTLTPFTTTLSLILILATFFSTLSSVASASPKGKKIPITCHSIIKLRHVATKHYLHSHEVQYGTGSGQQSVTAVSTPSDVNSYWTIKPSFSSDGSDCSPGSVLKNGVKLRLQHVQTKKFLHSHRHRSPLSGQQEVSCLEPLNTGDDWIVILDSNDRSGVWNQGEKFRLMHADTQMYLHSHKHTFGNPIPGQQEVTGFPTKGDSQNVWTAEEGIYLTSEE